MNKKITNTAVYALLSVMLITALCGCGRKSEAAEPAEPAAGEVIVSTPVPEASPEAESEKEEKLSDEQAMSAIENYCYSVNPDLERIVNEEEFPVYWAISSSEENETVVLFRSYTGAQTRYYINRITGETYVTEFVPGIMLEEERTDESFNARDYLYVD